ncbi:HTH_Tnp_Tc3_2 domain-containing protein [Trichonephila clavipes]|nr:HTH_Tnp_Tc3_2 domain-containing protein [Trichonephila clavipes]
MIVVSYNFFCTHVVPIPLEQESLHQVHLAFPRKSLTHQALLFIQLSQGNAPAVQKMSRRSKERAGHLAEANLKSNRPFRALPLTPEHRQLRLQWCQARSMWNATDWQKVVFSVNPGLFWGHMITVYGCGVSE